MVRVVSPWALAGLTLMSLPAAGRTAPVMATPKAEASVLLIKPLSLVRVNDMDFATLGVTTGGTATIDPIGGAMTVSGGLVHLNGTPSPARYAGSALKKSVVNIRVPKQPVLIRRVGGTETLSVSNFTLDGQDKRDLADAAYFIFAVGARITIPAGSVEGIYSGDIDVTVQYP
jgi:hypothetical protein